MPHDGTHGFTGVLRDFSGVFGCRKHFLIDDLAFSPPMRFAYMQLTLVRLPNIEI